MQGNDLGTFIAVVQETGDSGQEQMAVGQIEKVMVSRAADPQEEILKVIHRAPVTFLL